MTVGVVGTRWMKMRSRYWGIERMGHDESEWNMVCMPMTRKVRAWGVLVLFFFFGCCRLARLVGLSTHPPEDVGEMARDEADTTREWTPQATDTLPHCTFSSYFAAGRRGVC